VSALNLSTNLPFILPSFETFDFSYFIDVANVWGVDYDNSLDDSGSIRSSTGLGIDFYTCWSIKFFIYKPITKESSDKTETFRFNLGTIFR
jgi:outer membrane protein insertion porin family